MKRIRLFFLVVFVAAFQLPLQAQQLSESFEGNVFPPAGWKIVLVNGDVNWVRSTAKPNTGKVSAFMKNGVNTDSDDGRGEAWLITPLVYQIVSGDKITFFLQQEYTNRIPLPYFEQIQVYISTTGNNPANFTTLLQTIDVNTLADDYTKFEINFPSSVYGQNAYIAIRHTQYQGNGLFLDDLSAGSKLSNDVGSYRINLENNAIFTSGTAINIADTLINNGTSPAPLGIPVSYRINKGTPVTVNTSASMAPGTKTFVDFSGANAFVPSVPGLYELEVYTDWSSDINHGNDTLKYNITVQAPKTSFPYFTDFENPEDWTLSGSDEWEYVNLFDIGGIENPVVNPSGSNGTAALAFTFTSYGNEFYLRTPLLNFSGVNKPMLNFYVASKFVSNPQYNDSLQIVVSTDGGVTFGPPLYTKSKTTNSKLSTVRDPSGVQYFPNSANDWRHEIIDLSRYANMPNVIVAFKVISYGGNNVWIDNVKILDQPAAYYTAARISAPGTVTGAFNTQVQFVTVPVADSVRIEGHNAQPDSRLPEEGRFETNTASTSNDGNITSPNVTLDRYFTIAYSGNSVTRATYNISMDASGLTTYDLDKVYILKRADETGAWVALNTTRIGTELIATGLNKFSDFALGYYSIAVPVTVLSFSGKAVENSVELLWNTSQEANILSYDVQRWNGNDWIKIGNKASSKSSMQNRYVFTDQNAPVGLNLYRLKINSEMGSSTYSDIAKVLVSISGNKVYQNVPNPVRNYTIIRYDLAKSANVKILIYDVKGSQIGVLENSVKQAGSHQARWDGSNVPSGTYFYRVMIDNEMVSKSMLKVK